MHLRPLGHLSIAGTGNFRASLSGLAAKRRELSLGNRTFDAGEFADARGVLVVWFTGRARVMGLPVRSLVLGFALLTSSLSSGCGGAPEPRVQHEPTVRLPTARSTPEPEPVTLPPEDVLFGLMSELAAMRGCLGGPGALQLRWEVDKYGSAGGYEVRWSTRQAPEEVSCITKLIDARHFELPSGATRGIAEWTFVKELPTDPRFTSKKRARRPAKSRAQGVQFEPPGSLSNTDVDGVVQSGMRLYAHCLRAGVEAKSSIKGRLALSWNVDERGRATDVADAGSDLGDQHVVDCTAECFYALRYPSPKTQPVRITYSLLFNED